MAGAEVRRLKEWTVRATAPDVRIAEVRKIAREAAREDDVAEIIERWSAAPEFNLRSLAVWMTVARIDSFDSLDGLRDAMVRFAADEDWRVREESSYLMKAAMRRWIEVEAACFLDLACHPSDLVRRCVAVGAGRAGDPKVPARAKPLLKLMDSLVCDEARYVRRNTGPFAVGSYLLNYYVDPTFARIEKWSQMQATVVRWNAAAALSASGGKRFPERAAPILESLAKDEAAEVRRKAASALKKLGG
jgi:HEAT repeat protein